jgi:chromate transporter
MARRARWAPIPGNDRMDVKSSEVSLRELFRLFFVIGASSFGGGLSGWVYREVTQKRDWIKHDEMMAGIALAQVTPGANIANLCVYTGNELRGIPGAITALIAMLFVPFFASVCAYLAWDRISGYSALQAVVDGVTAAAVGFNLRVAYVGATRAARKLATSASFIATFVCVGLLQWPIVPTMAVIAPLSIIFAWPRKTADA